MITINEIKENIKCPQFGDLEYGKWGALRLEQRKAFKHLIDIVEDLQQENKQLKEEIYELRTRIDKTLQALKEILFYDEFSDTTNGFGNVKRELMFYLSECKTLEEFDEVLGDKE